MRFVRLLFFCHCCAILLGLTGMLVMLPHPEIWNGSSWGVSVFSFNMTYAGSFYIVFGAATLLLFGLRFVGRGRTLIFFFASTLISLSMELLGTSTGFPFGPYAYTNLLGYKILGHVPYAIPLSWFYMGFTSYLLASLLVARTSWRRKTLWTLLLGAYFLTVWDLALDPSMASPHLPVQFWHWYETGPYFGMPVRNLVGWSLTGLTYMSVSRFFWRKNSDPQLLSAWLLFGVYSANTIFAIALTLAAGIWQPSILALVLGLLPASLVLHSNPPRSDHSGGFRVTPFERISHLFVRQGSAVIVRKKLVCDVDGVEHIPQEGPVLLVVRHFHHLYDGCLLLATLPRRLHILVGLDWIQRPLLRRLMEFFCRTVAWPVVLREERLQTLSSGVYGKSEERRYLRQAARLVIRLLREGEALVIFPEAYPVIDPALSPRTEDSAFLPFRAGFARLLELAEKDGQTHVALIPVGLHYTKREHWHVTLRFGQALFRQNFTTLSQLIEAVEQNVHTLSQPQLPSAPMHTSI